MPVNPFEPDAAPRPAAGGRYDHRYSDAVPPDVRAPSPEEREERADETIEEPGYGHGV